MNHFIKYIILFSAVIFLLGKGFYCRQANNDSTAKNVESSVKCKKDMILHKDNDENKDKASRIIFENNYFRQDNSQTTSSLSNQNKTGINTATAIYISNCKLTI
jgi:hypothetical protein